MVASNPGPGLGLLLAYSLFGKGTAKKTAPGAIIIHFFGGIHELYFPYVLMKPLTLIGMILGGMSGTFVFQLFGSGLVAGPSPGSIFSYLALTPKGNFLGVILGVTVATIVSFLVTTFILKLDKSVDEDDALLDSIKKSEDMKAEGQLNIKSLRKEMTKISFACDAGFGSSALGASSFRKKLIEGGVEHIEVKNYRIEDVPKDSDIMVVHKNLEERARMAHSDIEIITIDSYLEDPAINVLLSKILKQ